MAEIEITGTDLTRFIQEAYDLSRPRGMGFIHATPGPLPAEEAASFIRPEGSVAVSLDYVRGRACKMTVWRRGDRLFIHDTWFDHSDTALAELLRRTGAQQAA